MNKHILVFDSGLGGTSILHALQQQLPEHRYSYALDNAAFPYGDKTDQYLLERSKPLFQKLLACCKPDLVIIACNTASTLLLDNLRASHDIPFVGVVPAIKPAASASRSKVIALLATPATINRPYIDNLIQAHADDCLVIRHSHPDLVTLAEHKLTEGSVDIRQLQTILEPLKQHPEAAKIDTFVLGCTHFSAIADELAAAWQTDAAWLDSTDAIVRRTTQLLKNIPGHKQPANAGICMTSAGNADILLKSLEMHSLSTCCFIEIS